MTYSQIDKDLVQFSKQAYTVSNLKDGNVEVYHKLYNDGLSISFRGTNQNENSFWSLIRDIATDIRFLPWYTRGLGWHPVGFTRAALRICDDIEKVAGNRKTPLYIDGHSLGAAVGAIVAAFLARKGYNLVAGRFFAIPRVGRLKSLRGKDVIGFIYGDDIVPSLPPFFSHDMPIKRIGGKLGPLKSHAIDNYIAEVCGD